MEGQKRFNGNVKYFDNGITIAGVIFVVLNFLREESIEALIKRDNIFSIIACGEIRKKLCQFINEISLVNLEFEIRKQSQCNLSDAVIGEFSKYNLGDSNNFNIEIGSSTYPTFKAKGIISNDSLTMLSGSLTKEYYKSNYKLRIEDIDLFIKLCNELPPFALVDYLHICGVHTFNKESLSSYDIELAKKLNKPKFYTNKNIYILRLPSNVSDYRLVSSVVADAIIKVSLQLEEYIYKTRAIYKSGGVSSIAKALSFLGLSKECINDIKFIRNFSCHGYTFSDCMIYGDYVKQFTLDYAITSLEKLLSELKEKAPDVYNRASTIICSTFVNVLVSAKYKLGIILGREILGIYPNYDKKELPIKNRFINNSCYDVVILDNLVDDVNSYKKVIKLNIQGTDETIYINDNETDRKLLNNFLEQNGYSIELTKSSKLIKEYSVL